MTISANANVPAWLQPLYELVRTTWYDHDPDCSYVRSKGLAPCDCQKKEADAALAKVNKQFHVSKQP